MQPVSCTPRLRPPATGKQTRFLGSRNSSVSGTSEGTLASPAQPARPMSPPMCPTPKNSETPRSGFVSRWPAAEVAEFTTRVASASRKANRCIPAATVIPVLIYPDVREAVAWLSAAFGFAERVRIGENHRAQLRFGDGAVIVGDVRNKRSTSPPGRGHERRRCARTAELFPKTSSAAGPALIPTTAARRAGRPLVAHVADDD